MEEAGSSTCKKWPTKEGSGPGLPSAARFAATEEGQADDGLVNCSRARRRSLEMLMPPDLDHLTRPLVFRALEALGAGTCRGAGVAGHVQCWAGRDSRCSSRRGKRNASSLGWRGGQLVAHVL